MIGTKNKDIFGPAELGAIDGTIPLFNRRKSQQRKGLKNNLKFEINRATSAAQYITIKNEGTLTPNVQDQAYNRVVITTKSLYENKS